MEAIWKSFMLVPFFLLLQSVTLLNGALFWVNVMGDFTFWLSSKVRHHAMGTILGCTKLLKKQWYSRLWSKRKVFSCQRHKSTFLTGGNFPLKQEKQIGKQKRRRERKTKSVSNLFRFFALFEVTEQKFIFLNRAFLRTRICPTRQKRLKTSFPRKFPCRFHIERARWFLVLKR